MFDFEAANKLRVYGKVRGRKNEYIIPLDHYIYSSLQPDLFLSNLEILVDDILHSALT